MIATGQYRFTTAPLVCTNVLTTYLASRFRRSERICDRCLCYHATRGTLLCTCACGSNPGLCEIESCFILPSSGYGSTQVLAMSRTVSMTQRRQLGHERFMGRSVCL